MAITGININVANTTLGYPPSVDSNSMICFFNARAVTNGDMAFSLETNYMLRSTDDLKTLGITAENNPDIVNQVTDYFGQNAGGILWIVGWTGSGSFYGKLKKAVQGTVENGFEYRPRQVAISFGLDKDLAGQDLAGISTEINELMAEGFGIVLVISQYPEAHAGDADQRGPIVDVASKLRDLSGENAPFIGSVIVASKRGANACVGYVLGYLSTLTVGTSIGDASLPTIGNNFYFCDWAGGADSTPKTFISTPCSAVSQSIYDILGGKQYIFARTRPPRNGLWFNDGATAADPTTALSTLEAGRTICSIVDELRSYFSPYLNNRIPVDANGDIRSDYKQVVLDGARSRIITPYIETGDISDARLELLAKNNDMTGTRTWEVKLSILPALTLRWIDGFVFYVANLT